MEGMKRKYEKPMLLKEEFSVDGMIASCAVQNPLPTQAEQCAYLPEGLGYTVFGEAWPTCTYGDVYFDGCYYESVNNLFSS